MSRLGARLKRQLDAVASPRMHPTAHEADALLQAHFDDSGQDLTSVTGGEWVAREAGPVHVVNRSISLDSAHGSRRLGAFFDCDASHVAQLTGDKRLGNFDPNDSLFLDIEATGLDHGAGTHAFVIGLAWREAKHLRLQQLVLTDPAHERAMLEHFCETLDRGRQLITFNGKSYDLTLLESRLVLNRFFSERECNLKLRPHLDLLHLSRNLYRTCWEDTRLQTLERHALGVTRIDDIPGSLVPSCWYHYQRTGDAGPLGGVIKHNEIDVLSMVTLAERVLCDSTPNAAHVMPRIQANLGRLLLRRRDYENAIQVLVRARSGLQEIQAHGETLRHLALAARRASKPLTARQALEALVCLPEHQVDDREALAIHLERIAKDFQAALPHAEYVAENAPSPRARRRVQRLKRRLLAVNNERNAEHAKHLG